MLTNIAIKTPDMTKTAILGYFWIICIIQKLTVNICRKKKTVKPSNLMGSAINGKCQCDNSMSTKEGCNWEHGLTAAIKIGTPEKTVGASQLHSGVY